jgi:hypothetical protein
MKRHQCPVCGVIIYLEVNGYYRCPYHGDFKINYNTGRIQKQNRCNDCECKDECKCKK